LTIVIRADRLVDGTGGAPISDAVLVVDDGTVVGTFAGAAPDGVVPADAEVIDLPGCTMLPGLIDAHVHLNFPGNGLLLEEIMTEPEGVLVSTATFAAQRALAAGITTVRDTGCVHSTVFDVRRSLELGHGTGARILACGQPITITGGHTWPLGGEADGVDGLRTKVRSMCKLGADAIKVMASGGGTRGTLSHRPSFTPPEMAAIVDEGHRLGRKVTAHCLNSEAIVMAVEAGVDQLEHAGFLVDAAGTQRFDPAAAAKIAEAGVAVTSTLAVGGSAVAAMRAKDVLTPAEQKFLDFWSVMLEDNVNQFAALHAAGVRIVAGTDAGWRFTPIDDLAMELELLASAGLSAGEALAAATGVTASTLGVADQFGTLTAGLAADVLVVAGNPLQNLSALRDVRLVLQGGQVRVGQTPVGQAA
jgi:imidazolonepropionase-like amidohydrolase